MFPNSKGENALRCKALEKKTPTSKLRAADSLPLSPPQPQLFLAPPCLVQCFTRRNLAGSSKAPFTGDQHFSLGNPGRAVFCCSSLTWHRVISMGKRWIEFLVLAPCLPLPAATEGHVPLWAWWPSSKKDYRVRKEAIE